MTESGDSSNRLREYSTPDRRHRRRRYLPSVLICVILVLAVVVTAIVLAFTVFKVRDPTTQLVSAKVSGISPRITLPAVNVEINVTLDLDILAHNPNRASFTHDTGRTLLYYRGTQVGDADVAPGRIASQGSENFRAAMTVEAQQFAAQLGTLVADVLAGEVGFDASSRIPGRVKLLGVFKLHAVALSECHVVIGFPDLKVRRQECSQETKL